MKTFFSELYKKLNTGSWPIVIALAFLIIGTVSVYLSPRSLSAFLILMTTPLILYFMKINMKVKIFIGLLLIILILPVLGIRNIFYLEVIFQTFPN